MSRPSISGLVKLRSEMADILRALGEAAAKARDPEEKRRISLARADLDSRLARIRNILARTKTLQDRRRVYRSRISAIEKRIKEAVGRQFRASARWLRRWKRL